MNKKEYLTKLRSALGNISTEARDEIIYDFTEHFDIGLEQGKTEEEISLSLGDPKANAKQYKAEFIVHQAHKNSSGTNVLRAVFAAISLGFFNLIFMIPVFAVVFSIIASFLAISLSLTISGVAVIIATILDPLLPAWVSVPAINPAVLIFGSISITALGLLFTIATVQLTKWCLKATAGYIKTNISIIGNKDKENKVYDEKY